jgi:hypothetical protein
MERLSSCARLDIIVMRQFSLGVQRYRCFSFSNQYLHGFSLSLRTVVRLSSISGESADRLCDDEVDAAFQSVGYHLVETATILVFTAEMPSSVYTVTNSSPHGS